MHTQHNTARRAAPLQARFSLHPLARAALLATLSLAALPSASWAQTVTADITGAPGAAGADGMNGFLPGMAGANGANGTAAATGLNATADVVIGAGLTVAGGAGGSGGAGGAADADGGSSVSGGAGGNGQFGGTGIETQNWAITNAGTVAGGHGGTGGAGGSGMPTGLAGLSARGGNGVVGVDVRITNTGRILGGNAGNHPTRILARTGGDAVVLDGGLNTVINTAVAGDATSGRIVGGNGGTYQINGVVTTARGGYGISIGDDDVVGLVLNRGTILGGLGPNGQRAAGIYNRGEATNNAGMFLDNGQTGLVYSASATASLAMYLFHVNQANNIAGTLDVRDVANFDPSLTVWGFSTTSQITTTGANTIDGVVFGSGTTTFASNANRNVVLTAGDVSDVLTFNQNAGLSNYQLVWDAVNNEWDLVCSGLSGSCAVGGLSSQLNPQDTVNALLALGRQWRSLFSHQTAALVNNMENDPTAFDARGIALSVGGAYTTEGSGGGQTTATQVAGAYRVSPNLRVGAWLDTNKLPSTAGISAQQRPMMGVYGVWQPAQVQGLQLRAALGHGQQDTVVTREVTGTSEAGSGSTRLSTRGASLVASMALPAVQGWSVTPYLGGRYTAVEAAAYTETASDSVTAPLSFEALQQTSTTAVAGVELSTAGAEQLRWTLALGLEHDLENGGNRYSATGVNTLQPLVFNDNLQKTRVNASVGAQWALGQQQFVTGRVSYRQQAFDHVASTSLQLSYQVGF